jgi:kynurenine formamidase
VGWEAGYRRLDRQERVALSERPPVNPGLESSVEMAARLWDWGVAAVGCDNPALEVRPRPVAIEDSLHALLLPRLGMPIAEFLLLDELAEACQEAGSYEFLFTAAPLNVTGGVGSPANALAIL